MKKYYNLRIFIYGENALDDINYLFKDYDKEFKIDKKHNNKIYITKDLERNWEYYIIPGEYNRDKNKIIEDYLKQNYEIQKKNSIKLFDDYKNFLDKYWRDCDYNQLNEKISEFLVQYTNFYDVLIIITNKLLDTNSRIIFKYFQGLYKYQNESPFMLFLTKKDNSPKVVDLLKLINNEYFDKRNVFAYKFPTNDLEIEEIKKFCIDCMNYYHEAGNCENNFQTHNFNILIIGQAGVGKSAFINQFLNKKMAKEGEGLLTTHKITSYLHPNYPIKIIDTPGIETFNSVLYMHKLIEEFETKTKDPKKRIDLILYFNNLKERSLISMEIDLIKYLLEKNKKIIFVLCDHGLYTQKQIERLTDIFKVSLKTITEPLSDNKKLDINEILQNIIPISLRQFINKVEIEDDDDYDEEVFENMKIKQCYGMDKLFKRIHEMFEKQKISISEINNSLHNYNLKEYIQKCELLEHFQKIEDDYINKIIESVRLINSYSKKGLFKIFFKEKKRKELVEQLISINSDKYIDTENFYYEIESLIDEIENKDGILVEFIISVSHLRDIADTSGTDFPESCDDHTNLIGYLCLKKFEKEYGQYDLNTRKYIKELAEQLNKAIDGFLEITKEWENTYKSLKEYKSNKEWVNKFFILNFSKYLK